MNRKRIIDIVLKSNLCCGCGLCASISKHQIEMSFDSLGFLRPTEVGSVEKRALEIIAKVCPGLNAKHSDNEAKEVDPFLGPVVSVRRGFSTNKTIRFRGASGGAITGLANYLLEKKKIDFVIHTGKATSNPVINECKISSSTTDLLANAGSRYSPSAPLDRIEELISENYKYLFIGKPCDVLALRNYSKHNRRIAENVKYMFAFFCAGVPSINATRRLLSELGFQEDSIADLRYRGCGWPGVFVVRSANGEEQEMSYNESWGKLGRSLQFRCKICADGTGESADLSFGDAWLIGEDGRPDFSERDGISFIVSRNSVGEALIRESITGGAIAAVDSNVHDIEQAQPYQYSRKQSTLSRLVALRLLFRKCPSYNMEELRALSSRLSLKEKAKQSIGTALRAIKTARKQDQ